MIKKICKFFAMVSCMLSVVTLSSCSGKSHTIIKVNGEEVKEIELIEMSSVSLDLEFVAEDDVNTYSVTYRLESEDFMAGENGDYEFMVNSSKASFLNYSIGEGSYDFDLIAKYDEKEYTQKFKVKVHNSYEYVTSMIAEKIVEKNDKDPDLGYCDIYTSSSTSTLFMVDGKNDDTLELFTIFSSSGSSAMASIEIMDNTSFSLFYSFEVDGSYVAEGYGEYVSASITEYTSVTPFSSFSGSQQSLHQEMAASILQLALLALQQYASKINTSFRPLSFPYALGFSKYY